MSGERGQRGLRVVRGAGRGLWLAGLGACSWAGESRRALARLHVATREDFKALGSRLDSLERKLDDLTARRRG